MKKHALLCLSLASFLAGQPSYAQDFWKPLNGPRGEKPQSIVSTDDGHTFIYSGGAGVLQTSDDGDTWIPINNGLPISDGYNFTMAAGTDGNVFISFKAKIFKLNQNGDAWIELVIPNLNPNNKVYTNPNGHLYVVTSVGIHWSTDNGDSFNIFPLIGGGFNNNFHFFGNGHNFCVVFNGGLTKLYRFDDDGSNQMEIASTNQSITDILYLPSGAIFYTDETIHRSYDNGETWESIELVPGAPIQPYLTILDEFPSGKLIVVTGWEAFLSQDEGTSWYEMDDPNNFFRGSEFVYGHDANTAYFSSQTCKPQYFLRTKDNGQTLERIEQNIALSHSMFEIIVDQKQNIYANTCRYSTWELSQDGGNTWLPFYITEDSLSVYRIEENSNGQLFVTTTNKTVMRSDNGGDTWTDITPDSLSSINIFLHVSPQNVVFLYDGQKLYVSTNNGETWSAEGLPAGISFQKFSSHTNGSIYTGSASGIIKSNNLGKTWEAVPIPNGLANITAFHINAKGHFYFRATGQQSGTFVSYDNLASYTNVLGDVYYTAIASNIKGDVFIKTDSIILYSNDDGNTWEDRTNGLDNPANIATLFIDDKQYLYASVNGGVIHQSILPTSEINLLKGKIWFDENENCTNDGNDTALSNWIIQAEANGETLYGSTTPDGQYNIHLPSGNHSVSAVLPNGLWASDCTLSAGVTFTGSLDTNNVDFPITAKEFCPLMEVDISTPLLRRCFSNDYTVSYCNKGTQEAIGVEISVKLDPFLQYISSSLPLLSQNGNIYTFAISELGINECGHFRITTKVDCDAILGYEHCVEAKVTDYSCTSVPAPLPHTECQPNVGSFDPNDKTAFVGGRTESEWVKANTDIEYKIRFQNTGTDTAFTVVVQDQLSNLLNPVTVRPGASSHPYQFELLETGMLRFTFHDILLPDSNINEQASHGFVKFIVSQKTDIPDGNVITNLADIFFDFNAAVTTNKVELTVGEPNAVGEKGQLYRSRATPNPFTGQTIIEISGLDGQPLQLQLFNNTGVLLKENNFTAPACQLDVPSLPSGIYFYLAKKDGELVGSGKLIISK